MGIKSFENYKVEDFVADESFINYHLYLSEKDRLFWKQWLIDNPAKKVMANQAGELIQLLSLTLNKREYQDEFKKIEAVISAKNSPGLFTRLNPDKTFQSSRRNKRSIKYIVLCVLILAAGAFYLLTRPFQNKSLPLSSTVNEGNRIMTFTLSDSTVVTLAPNSMLEYPSSFTGSNRQVYLKGEAGFNVKRNEHFPFKVHTENIVTTVLGTVFNIKKPGDSAVVVELLKGKVKVEIEDTTARSAAPILLYPEEKATYVFRDKHFYKNLNPAEFNISFSHNSFEEIAARLKTVFGKTVVNNSSTKKWRFTGEFRNTTAREIIENICVIKNLNSKAVGDTIIINN
ncbi:MAG: FecR family protein [Ferruginibacter sp.]